MSSRTKKRAKVTPARKPKSPATGAVDALGAFTPQERLIYRYYDGEKIRTADPLKILLRISSYEGVNAQFDMQQVESGTTLAEDSMVRIIAMVREIFEVEELHENGNGLKGIGDYECVSLLGHFSRFVGGFKKKANTTPTSPNSTASPSSDPSTTLPSSDFGSTETAASFGEGLPSQPE